MVSVKEVCSVHLVIRFCVHPIAKGLLFTKQTILFPLSMAHSIDSFLLTTAIQFSLSGAAVLGDLGNS